MVASIGFKTLVYEGSPKLHGKGKRTDIALYVITVCQYAKEAFICVFSKYILRNLKQSLSYGER
jgi:hypothetical protein